MYIPRPIDANSRNTRRNIRYKLGFFRLLFSSGVVAFGFMIV